MNVKETLEKLIEQDELDNISLNETGFMIYFGDILNTEPETGDTYYLLDTYVYIPYTLIDNQVRLHRGIVNEYETGGSREGYEYSGFVHYGGHFCWGQCGVDIILQNAILEQSFTEDTYYSLVLHFQKYLSTSSHDSGARTTLFKKLDIPDLVEKEKIIPVSVRYIDNIPFIFEYAIISEISGNTSVDYTKPYKRVIKEFRDKSFVYKGNTIIPKVVEHCMKADTKILVNPAFSNAKTFLELIEDKKLNKIQNEINNKKRVTLQDCIHQLTNPQHRVDGSVCLQS